MILIAIDHAHGAPRRGAFELVSAARDLGGEIAAVVLGGPDAGPVAAALAAFVPRVIHVDDATLDHASHERRVTALAGVATELGAEAVLLGAGRSGQAVGPRLAWRLDGALLEDVAAVRREGSTLVAERLAYLSRASLTVRAEASPVVVSVKAGAYPAAAPADAPGTVASRAATFTAADDAARLGERRSVARGRVALEEADVVVCGGRGLGDADAFERHVVGLAHDLGAGVASTRAVVDAGWRPYDEQVGQTGKNVAPQLYFALGVSGAVQHLSGMNRSGTVVAINKDGDAPIFKVADYGIVGDVHEVLPALRAALSGLD